MSNNIDIEVKYSTQNNEIIYNSCLVSLKNMAILEDKPHINKYEFIKEVIVDFTNLNSEEIIINE